MAGGKPDTVVREAGPDERQFIWSDGASGRDAGAVSEFNSARRQQLSYGDAGADFGALLHCLFEEKPGGARRIENGVIEDAQATGHARAQIRLGLVYAGGVEDLHAD